MALFKDVNIETLVKKHKYDADAFVASFRRNPVLFAKLLYEDMLGTGNTTVASLSTAAGSVDPGRELASRSYTLLETQGTYLHGTPQSHAGVVIHWPSVISSAADDFVHLPSSALLPLMFDHIIARKSCTTASLLLRKVKFDYLVIARNVLEDDPFNSEIPEAYESQAAKCALSPIELEVLRYWLLLISVDHNLNVALRRAFTRTYPGFSAESATQKISRHFPTVTKTVRSQLSLVYPVRLRSNALIYTCAYKFMNPRDDDHTSYNRTFYPKAASPLLEELRHAWEFAAYQGVALSKDVKRELAHRYGVAIRVDKRSKQLIKDRRWLYVYLPYWLEYRKSNNPALFKGLGLPKNYNILESRISERTIVMDAIYDKVYNNHYYQKLSPSNKIKDWHGEVAREHHRMFGIPNPPERSHYLVIDTRYLHDLLLRHRASVEGRRVAGPGRKKSTVNTRYYIDTFTVPYVSDTRGEFSIEVGRYMGKIYFRPPWVDILEGDHDIMDLAKGANIHISERPSGTTRYYTYEFLVGSHNFDSIRKFVLRPEMSTVFDFILPYTRMTLSEFKRRRAQTNPRPGSNFAPSELEAVRLYYRPDATPAMMKALRDACPTRDARAIMLVAKRIREEMFKRGVFNLKSIPHRNYTEKMSQEIRRAKRSWQNQQAKEAKEAKKLR